MPATAAAISLERPTRAQIEEFLSQKRFAAVGVARDSKDFTRSLMREFLGRLYDVVPVNPGATEIEGRKCFARVQDIVPPVAAALLLTSPAITEEVVRDCAAAGVTQLWMYRAGGAGAVSPVAVAFCREKGISVIAGECPFMFLPRTGFPHRVHGLIKRIVGSYPR